VVLARPLSIGAPRSERAPLACRFPAGSAAPNPEPTSMEAVCDGTPKSVMSEYDALRACVRTQAEQTSAIQRAEHAAQVCAAVHRSLRTSHTRCHHTCRSVSKQHMPSSKLHKKLRPRCGRKSRRSRSSAKSCVRSSSSSAVRPRRRRWGGRRSRGPCILGKPASPTRRPHQPRVEQRAQRNTIPPVTTG
jgi:hypothetical protein